MDEQAICAVGLAKAKPGIFVEAIQYLLILATPAEVSIFHSFLCYTHGVALLLLLLLLVILLFGYN